MWPCNHPVPGEPLPLIQGGLWQSSTTNVHNESQWISDVRWYIFGTKQCCILTTRNNEISIQCSSHQVVLVKTQPSAMTKMWIQRVKSMTGAPKPQCPEGHVRLEFDLRFWDYCSAFISRRGPLQPPTNLGETLAQSLEMNPTIVAIQMSTLAPGMSCITEISALSSAFQVLHHRPK